MNLSSLVDRHRGQKFLVVGCGPSVRDIPTEEIEDKSIIKVGVNRAWYWLDLHYHIWFDRWNNRICSRRHGWIDFAWSVPFHKIDLDKNGFLSIRGQSGLTALSLAHQLGAAEVTLYGLDLQNCPTTGAMYFYDRSSTDKRINDPSAELSVLTAAVEDMRSAGVKIINRSLCELK